MAFFSVWDVYITYITRYACITVGMEGSHYMSHTPADVGDVRSRVALDLLSDEVQVHVSSHLHFPQVDL